MFHTFFGLQRSTRSSLVAAGLVLLTLTGCGGGLFKRSKAPSYSGLDSGPPLDGIDKLSDKQLADVKFAAARTKEAGGSLEEALMIYREVDKLDPKRPDVPHRMAICYDKLAQFDKSPEHYQKALQLQPGNADIFCDIGYSQYLQERYQDAEMNLRQAVKLRPGHTRAQNNLGMLLARTGRVDESLQAFHRGGAKPEDAHTNVAFALASRGQFEDARKHYKLALAHDPEFSKAQEGLSDIAMLQEKADRVRAVAEEFGTVQQEPLAKYASGAAAPTSVVVGPKEAMAQAGEMSAPRAAARPQVAPVKAQAVTQTPVERKPVSVERQQVSAEPAPWARQRMSARPTGEDAPPVAPQVAKAEPEVAKEPAKASPAKSGKAPKLSFSKGALHRDRYLEEQTDPALQEAGFSTASE